MFTFFQLYEFRKLTSDPQNFEIPERPENRRTTDKKWLIAFIVVLVVLIPFLIYTLLHTELKQLSGSDNCGNFCGYKNKKYDEWACTGKDYTEQKYLHLTGTAVFNGIHVRGKECVAECPYGTVPTFNTCLPKDTNNNTPGNPNMSLEAFVALVGEIGRDIGRGWWAILLSAVVSCLLCFGTMSLFRWAVDFVVWFILIGSIGILAILGGLCWYAYFHFKDDHHYKVGNTKDQGAVGFLVLAIFFSIIVAVLIIVITCMVKRVKLIIALFREASKAIFDVPSMILIPVYTSILVTLSFLIFVVLTFFMALAGKLSEVAPNYLEYRLDGVMITALAYNIFGYIWVTEFIIGAQYIIIAGGVSAWFFTRNKHYLDSPLWTSFTNFTHFHLGTVAIGSLVITLMSIVRALLKSLAENAKTKWIIDCCLSNIEEFIRFLSKNAYIQTAMHGQPFFKSGKRAAKLLVSNAANVIAVNSIGDFVLVIAQLLLMVVSTTVAVFIAKATGLTHYWAIAIICAFVAVCMAATFFAIFEATIDCIFICFCEDTTLNDGMARPYFMSKGLMQFIEDSKAIMPKKK
ncbi:hypothetical protein WA026_020973 [Henosepilachna vigintioctopunctata]|uniref:Choline transporter-like protein n=1 Tax=Henosepilachna vigintioctopunctata TaxID=420089 RepID=A0AAW1VI35_9CUCU